MKTLFAYTVRLKEHLVPEFQEVIFSLAPYRMALARAPMETQIWILMCSLSCHSSMKRWQRFRDFVALLRKWVCVKHTAYSSSASIIQNMNTTSRESWFFVFSHDVRLQKSNSTPHCRHLNLIQIDPTNLFAFSFHLAEYNPKMQRIVKWPSTHEIHSENLTWARW